ncbi:MAG: class I SAM-dependent methyltransferase [Vicinamibacterales bacterium]
MSGFSAAWLGLREGADHAARSGELSADTGRRLAEHAGSVSSRHPLRIVDLATGTGSNPRFLASHLPEPQQWTLLDADAQLLTAIPVRMAAWASRHGLACVHTADGVHITSASRDLRLNPRRADLSRFPIAALGERPDLVTSSALLDLVSAVWLASLADACASIHATVLFALTYDGRTTMSHGHPDDVLVLELVNLHQKTDKGFGPALGPDAAEAAAVEFARVGYEVRRERSDWTIGPHQRSLQDELIAGWASAACEIRPEETARIRRWEEDRREAAATIGLVVTVGHEDLAAWPHGIPLF